MLDPDKITEILCEVIEEETGITVKPSEFTIDFDGEQLKILLFNENFTQTTFDPDDLEEDIAYSITENIERLSKKITEARIQSLEKDIDRRYTLLRELTFHIENRGYLSKYRHYTIEEEVERDYPELVLVVTKNGEEHYFEIDPYQTSEPVNIKEITAKLDE